MSETTNARSHVSTSEIVLSIMILVIVDRFLQCRLCIWANEQWHLIFLFSNWTVKPVITRSRSIGGIQEAQHRRDSALGRSLRRSRSFKVTDFGISHHYQVSRSVRNVLRYLEPCIGMAHERIGQTAERHLAIARSNSVERTLKIIRMSKRGVLVIIALARFAGMGFRGQ